MRWAVVVQGQTGGRGQALIPRVVAVPESAFAGVGDELEGAGVDTGATGER